MPITKREAEEMHTESDVIQWRMSQRYSRDPSKRREARLTMDYADQLERARSRLVFFEFSPTWVNHDGSLP